jgi:predicted dehydrogenase
MGEPDGVKINMNENQGDAIGVNRRDFLKGSSVTTLMTMLGGVELLAQTNAPPADNLDQGKGSVKVAVIGLGAWGREILNNLSRLKQADIAAICDNYPAFMKRAAKDAPQAKQVADYNAILQDKDIKGVIIATPTHAHKEVALAALKAGKHVYCEAPLANTIADARDIALAAKAAKQQIFQAGLQLRSEPERLFLVPFIRSNALGSPVMVRAQWHKKQSWRATSANAEREKAMNWRLNKETSLGLVGEIGCHHIDQANWFLNRRPIAVSGFGSIVHWKDDGRDVPDTVQAIFEYPGGVNFFFDATLANSFDADYAVFYGSDSAVMVRETSESSPNGRESKAWLFKEVDSPLLGWEIYASKEKFFEEVGISLIVNASKSVKNKTAADGAKIALSPLANALKIFLSNMVHFEDALSEAQLTFKDDAQAIEEQMQTKGLYRRDPHAGYLEGYQATVLAIKANEAVTGSKRVEIKPDSYELA